MALTVFLLTMNEKKVYSSESIIYTGIASGYSLNGNSKADFYSTSNAFDNLISLIESRETKEDVAITLLAEHLLQKKANSEVIAEDAYEEFQELIPANIRKKLRGPDVKETKARMVALMQSSDDNILLEILNSTNPYYSLKALNTIRANRISNSDLIRITYETNDAGICKRTLELLEETFMRKHRLLKEGQTESVVRYFEEATQKAFNKLDSSENLFLQFNKQHDIINYYEQTKAIAGEREDLYALEHSLVMDKVGSNSSLDKVNDNLKGRVYQSLYNSEIAEDRKSLADTYAKISAIEFLKKEPSQEDLAELKTLKREAAEKEKKLREAVDNLYVKSNTVSGIPNKTILDEWIKTTLSFEESRARLAVMDKRKREFEAEYKRFAPLGAMLKKIERQINVSEQAYLELLHGLNLARLNQQNAELTTKLNVVDPPFLPVKANASKRMIQVILAFVLGVVLVVTYVLANALINKTLLEPQRARKMVDLPFLSLFPVLNGNPKFVRMAKIRMVQQILSKLELSENASLSLAFISTQGEEGKTTLAQLLQKELQRLEYSVEIKQWDEKGTGSTESQITLWEFPALDGLILKPGLFPSFDMAILVARANRVWTRIDKEVLSLFQNACKKNIWLLLNGVETDFAEEYVGEVPKSRNYFRRLIKQLVKFQFGQKKSIK